MHARLEAAIPFTLPRWSISFPFCLFIIVSSLSSNGPPEYCVLVLFDPPALAMFGRFVFLSLSLVSAFVSLFRIFFSLNKEIHVRSVLRVFNHLPSD